MSIASTETFLSHVAAHGGVATDLAERATRAVLADLGRFLSAPMRQLIADELPAPLAADLVAAPGPVGQGLSATHARELVASVCRVLAEELSEDALRGIRAAVPAALADLLVEPSPERPGRTVEPRRTETLSTGRGTSHHPVSEAHDPRERGSTPWHRNLAEGHPGADESLSTGQPGSDRTLAGRRRD